MNSRLVRKLDGARRLFYPPAVCHPLNISMKSSFAPDLLKSPLRTATLLGQLYFFFCDGVKNPDPFSFRRHRLCESDRVQMRKYIFETDKYRFHSKCLN